MRLIYRREGGSGSLPALSPASLSIQRREEEVVWLPGHLSAALSAPHEGWVSRLAIDRSPNDYNGLSAPAVIKIRAAELQLCAPGSFCQCRDTHIMMRMI